MNITIKVNVKWGKQLYKDIELDLSQNINTFKHQVYDLSRVPVDKQKLMAKGKVMKDEQPWSTYPSVKNGV
jgi:ubiquitin carboxyl-terminal hydrolase 14